MANGGRPNGSGVLSALSGIFGRGNNNRENQIGEITAMCALRDKLVIGFSNGVLVVLDTDKLEFNFSHK